MNFEDKYEAYEARNEAQKAAKKNKKEDFDDCPGSGLVRGIATYIDYIKDAIIKKMDIFNLSEEKMNEISKKIQIRFIEEIVYNGDNYEYECIDKGSRFEQQVYAPIYLDLGEDSIYEEMLDFFKKNGPYNSFSGAFTENLILPEFEAADDSYYGIILQNIVDIEDFYLNDGTDVPLLSEIMIENKELLNKDWEKKYSQFINKDVYEKVKKEIQKQNQEEKKLNKDTNKQNKKDENVR